MNVRAGMTIAVVVAVLTVVAHPQEAQEEGPPSVDAEMTTEDIRRHLLSEGGASRVAALARQKGSKFYWAARSVLDLANRHHFVHATENLLQLGFLHRRLVKRLEDLVDADAIFSARVEGARKTGPHRYCLMLNVTRVWRGSLRLTRDNTPLLLDCWLEAGASLWCSTEKLKAWGNGPGLVVSAKWRGKHLVGSGPYKVWPQNGDEQQLLKRLEPLFERDPRQILDGLREGDETVRWLSQANVILNCGKCGNDLQKLASEPRLLTKERLAKLHPRILAAFEVTHRRIVWSDEDSAFVIQQ